MTLTDADQLLAERPAQAPLPEVVDHVAVARLYGEPLFAMPQDLYIPPDALEVFLEAFEGPLDLLLYLIRKQNFNILDIPMAALTRQYLSYVDEVRSRNLELAAEYLLMAAMLIEIKSRMLLPRPPKAENGEPEEIGRNAGEQVEAPARNAADGMVIREGSYFIGQNTALMQIIEITGGKPARVDEWRILQPVPLDVLMKK